MNTKLYMGIAVVVIIGAGIYIASSPNQASAPDGTSTAQERTPATQPTTFEYHDNIYLTKTDPAKGVYLTDFAGMTLYTFDQDQPGSSTCIDACAATWKPYTSGATAQKTFPSNITVITRTDGNDQFAWKGMPLYYYTSDANMGDLKGDGVEGTWHVAKP